MKNENLPPAPDLKGLILVEHRRAELKRLEEGQAGCGCTDCQTFYQTLELEQYGKRVVRLDDVILIKEKVRQIPDIGTSRTDDLPSPDKKRHVAKMQPGERLLPDTGEARNGIMQHKRGRPQKSVGEPVNRSTAWRRQQKQGVLSL